MGKMWSRIPDRVKDVLIAILIGGVIYNCATWLRQELDWNRTQPDVATLNE